MTKNINLIKEKLINNNFAEINKDIWEEFCEFLDIDKLIKIDFTNIDGEEGFLVLTKKLSYEINFISLESMEAENLFLSINEKKALDIFEEYLEAFK